MSRNKEAFDGDGSRLRAVNVMEEVAAEVVDEVLSGLPGACRCEQCRADVLCLALNQLPSRYVVHRWGEILSRAEFESPQRKAEIVTAVIRAAHKIKGRPHDETPSRRRGEQP